MKRAASPGNHSGPLIALKNFSPTVVRWCMMHVVHLGILYVCNGACLTFVCTKKTVICFLCRLDFHEFSLLMQTSANLRKLLLDIGFFTPKNEKLSFKLAMAYKDFKGWCSENKVSCSQPPFTEGLVPCLKFIGSSLRSINLPKPTTVNTHHEFSTLRCQLS